MNNRELQAEIYKNFGVQPHQISSITQYSELSDAVEKKKREEAAEKRKNEEAQRAWDLADAKRREDDLKRSQEKEKIDERRYSEQQKFNRLMGWVAIASMVFTFASVVLSIVAIFKQK